MQSLRGFYEETREINNQLSKQLRQEQTARQHHEEQSARILQELEGLREQNRQNVEQLQGVGMLTEEVNELKRRVHELSASLSLSASMQHLADSSCSVGAGIERSTRQTGPTATTMSHTPIPDTLAASFNYAENLNDLASMLRNVPVGSRISLSPQVAALALSIDDEETAEGSGLVYSGHDGVNVADDTEQQGEAVQVKEEEEQQGNAVEVEDEEERNQPQGDAVEVNGGDAVEVNAVEVNDGDAVEDEPQGDAVEVGTDLQVEVTEEGAAYDTDGSGGGWGGTDGDCADASPSMIIDTIPEPTLEIGEIANVYTEPSSSSPSSSSSLPAPLIPKEVANRLQIPQTCSIGFVRTAIRRFGAENLNRSSVPFLKSLCDHVNLPYTSPKKDSVTRLLSWANLEA